MTSFMMDKSGEMKRALEAAEKAIHANDTARLDRLIAEHPGLLTWHNPDDECGVLLYATISYGVSRHPLRSGIRECRLRSGYVANLARA